MISMDKNGGRTIHLFIPFEFDGRKIESITLAPVRFGHSLRWAAGDWRQSIHLLVELAGIEEAVIREIRYPDADRVMEAFLAMMPQEIRDDIANGRIPEKQPTAAEVVERARQRLAEATQTAQVATNGGGDDQGMPQNFQGPGVPLPETGFDLSDEP